MAGATNKSAKGLGYSARQIEAVRKSGGILSHAALMSHGEPARPTKAYKALAADMDERKKGLQRPSGKAPEGWQKAARGEGADERAAATAARAAFVAKREGQAKRAALAQRGVADVSRGMMANRKAEGARRAVEAAGQAKRADLARRGVVDVSRAMMAGRKAKAAEANRPDPHAETRARIASLEQHLERGKQANKIIRAEQKRGGTDWEQRAAQRIWAEKLSPSEGAAHKMVKPDFAGRRGMPDYEFTNTGATIRRLKDQIGMDRKKGVPMNERKIRLLPQQSPKGLFRLI